MQHALFHRMCKEQNACDTSARWRKVIKKRRVECRSTSIAIVNMMALLAMAVGASGAPDCFALFSFFLLIQIRRRLFPFFPTSVTSQNIIRDQALQTGL